MWKSLLFYSFQSLYMSQANHRRRGLQHFLWHLGRKLGQLCMVFKIPVIIWKLFGEQEGTLQSHKAQPISQEVVLLFVLCLDWGQNRKLLHYCLRYRYTKTSLVHRNQQIMPLLQKLSQTFCSVSEKKENLISWSLFYTFMLLSWKLHFSVYSVTCIRSF